MLEDHNGFVLDNKWEGDVGQAMLTADICPLNKRDIGLSPIFSLAFSLK